MITVKQYRTDEGVRVCLVREPERQRKFIQVLVMDAGKTSGLTVKRVPLDETRHMAELLSHGTTYPLIRAARIFRRFGKSHGASKSARKFLQECSL